MAPDAVVDLVQRLLGVHAVIGQRETLAMPPVVFRQAQHGDAVALDGFDRHQMLRVDAARHVEQRAAAMVMPVRPVSAWPRRHSAVLRPVPRDRFPKPRHARRTPRSVRGAPMRASSAARRAAPSKPEGSGYFFTAWRCTNSRLQAWIGSSASVSCSQRVGFRLDAEQLRHELVQMRTERDDQVGFVAARRRCRARRGRPAGAGAGRRLHRRGSSGNCLSRRIRPSRSARSAKVKPKPRQSASGTVTR